MARKLLLFSNMISADKEITLTQSALADHLGVTREAVSKILSKWQRSGWIELGRSKIRIVQADALREMALPLG